MDYVHKKSARFKTMQEETLRGRLMRFLQSSTTLFVLLLSIIVTVALLVVETDCQAEGRDVPVVVRVANYFLLIFYTAEVVIRMYVDQKAYVKSVSNLVDLMVLLLDVSRLVGNTDLGGGFLVLRTFRLIRVARTIQVANWLPDLATMVRGLAGAFTALAWGCVLMLFMLAVWGILATNLIHPLNQELTRQGVWRDAGCERCERAFSTVGHSMLTFTQQIVAGDSWGLISLPIIEAHPWTAAFFMMVLLSVQLALVNMILAVVLDKANASRQESEKELIAYREKERAHGRMEMLKLCQTMDKDNSGCLSEMEILHGYEENDNFRTIMQAMDIEKEDLELVFRLMDADCNGRVQYAEFTEQLFKMKTYDMHTLLVFIRFYVSDLWRKMKTLQASISPELASESPQNPLSPHANKEPEDLEAELIEVHGRIADMASHRKVGADLSEHSTMASAWASEVDRASQKALSQAMLLPAEEVRLLTGPLSQDMGRLREDLQLSLDSLSQKIEGQMRLLQALPLLPEQPAAPPVCSQREQQARGWSGGGLLPSSPPSANFKKEQQPPFTDYRPLADPLAAPRSLL